MCFQTNRTELNLNSTEQSYLTDFYSLMTNYQKRTVIYEHKATCWETNDDSGTWTRNWGLSYELENATGAGPNYRWKTLLDCLLSRPVTANYKNQIHTEKSGT